MYSYKISAHVVLFVRECFTFHIIIIKFNKLFFPSSHINVNLTVHVSFIITAPLFTPHTTYLFLAYNQFARALLFKYLHESLSVWLCIEHAKTKMLPIPHTNDYTANKTFYFSGSNFHIARDLTQFFTLIFYTYVLLCTLSLPLSRFSLRSCFCKAHTNIPCAVLHSVFLRPRVRSLATTTTV